MSLLLKVGHVFVGIKQGNIERFYGKVEHLIKNYYENSFHIIDIDYTDNEYFSISRN